MRYVFTTFIYNLFLLEKAKAIEQKIASIREEQNKVVEKSKNISADEVERIQRKEAILAQYSQVADGAG